LTKYVEKLQQEVDRELNGLENSKHRNTRVLSLAQEALVNRNLGGKALQILLDSNLAAFGADGARLQIELALMTGRVREVKKWFEDTDDPEKGLDRVLGAFSYSWWRMMLAAVTGDYAEADKHLLDLAGRCASSYQLTEMVRGQAQVGLVLKREIPALTVPNAVALLVSKALLDAPQSRVGWWTDITMAPGSKDNPLAHSTRWVGLDEQTRTRQLVMFGYACSAPLLDEAQVHLLRGLLALEQGDVKRAAEAFRTAAGRLQDLPPALPPRALAEDYLWNLYECWGLRPFGLAQR